MKELTLGEKLRKLRKEKGLTMIEVARKIGVTSSALGNYEKDYREPNISILKQLANIYDVSMDFLLGESQFNAKDRAYFQILDMFSGAFVPTETASEAFIQIINISSLLTENELKTLKDYFSFLLSRDEKDKLIPGKTYID